MHPTSPELAAAEEKVRTALADLKRVRDALPGEAVKPYTLRTAHGPVDLAEMFGSHDRLLVVHNMGRGCAYCTLWADGFNGVTKHLENAMAFWVVSDDEPDAQRAFATDRGWTFKMASAAGTTFSKDMGFLDGKERLPGASAFVRKGDRIERVSTATFGPGDAYSAIWHMGSLFPGEFDWGPKFSYARKAD